jgi:hypothetical protein
LKWATPITDHTALSNIGSNTHAQIDTHIAGALLADGTTPLTANWDVGAYTITSAGLVLADNESLTLGTGSDYTIKWDATDAVHTIGSGDFVFTGGSLELDNNEEYRVNDMGGTARPIAYLDSSDRVWLGAGSTGWGGLTFVTAGTGIHFYVNRAVASDPIAGIAADGRFKIGNTNQAIGQLHIESQLTTTRSLQLTGIASQTADYFYITDSTSTEVFSINASGITNYAATMGDSTADPTTDAPVDWVQIEIGGTTRYIPAYTAS